ncbi:MAG: RHS repeat-associated core domain-containing protein, partial [Gemmatimonadaceae bacterium]
LYMQLNSSGAWTTEYSDLPGIDQPQAITTSAGATYYVARDDRSGSVAGLVRPSDDSTVAKYTYTPFGSLIAGQSVDTVPNELKFAAREYDAETGLYYFRNRYYDPQVGRFVSEDPAGLGGGINAYAFAGNDPINGRDPQGLKAIPELPLVVTTASRDCDWIDPYECGDVSGWTQWWNGLGSAGPTGSLPLPSGPGGGSSALPQTENDCSGARTHAAIEGGIDLALGVGRVAVGLFFAPETGFLSFYEAWGGAMQALSGVVDLYGAASGHVAGAEKVADVTSSFGTVSGLATLIGTGNVQYGATASSLEGLALAAGLGGWAATRPAVPIAAGEALGARGVGWADHVYGAAGLAGVSACH